MIELLNTGAYLVNGIDIIPDTARNSKRVPALCRVRRMLQKKPLPMES
jgi:hypothetical protein